jgi:hypothetical protein
VTTHHLMSLNPRITPRAVRRIAAACGAGVLLVGAAACGSSGGGGNGDGNAQGGPANTYQNPDGQSARNRQPGANGKVVAVTGSTAQVQNQVDGQVAVSWNGTTTFTKQVPASLADVKVGTCVMVASAEGTTGSSSSSGSAPTAITASTVRITPKSSDGTCSGGLGSDGGRPQFSGGGPGSGPSGMPTGMPSGMRSGMPGGGQNGSGGPQLRGFGGAFGEVTAVSASTFTVKSTVPRFDGSSSTPSTESITVTVTVGKATTYTTTGKAAASDVRTGVCLRAQGAADSTGAVTARTIALSPASHGECEATFRRATGAGGPGASTQES